MKKMLLAAVALATLSTGAYAAPAYEYSSAASLSDGRDFTLGFSFSLDRSITIDALGYSTLNLTTGQTVGLWTSTGTLLASTTVLPTDAVDGHFAYHDIADITLGAGSYVLAGTFTGGNFASALSGVTTLPGFTWLTDLQVYGSGLLFPTNSTGGGYGQNGIPLVNFSTAAVPEPATWAMMIGGLGLVGASMRRKKAVVSFA